jgi:predicted phage terminase large subunit-like protein
MLGMLTKMQTLQRKARTWRTARRPPARPDAVPSLTTYWQARYPRYDLAPHIALMIQALEALGPDEGLIITMPPRHSKTETVKAWLEWMLGQHPESEAIYASYAVRLARTSSRSIRNEVATGLAFPRYFPHVGLAADAQGATDWGTTRKGFFRAAGVGGSITGMGASLAVIDDPLKDRKAAESEVVREGVWEWFTSALLTRLAPGARVVLMHTRWHPDDLAGRVLERLADGEDAELGGLTWTHLNLPALAEENDPLGRAAGVPLWPKRFGLKKLLGMQATDAYNFEALYQQRPRKRGGQVFSDAPTRYSTPLQDVRLTITCDTASSKRSTADYTAFVVLAGTGHGPGLYADVLEVQHARLNLAQLTVTAQDLQARYGVPVVVEETAQSMPIIEHLRMNGVVVRAVRPLGDKFTRSQPAATAWNAGRIRVPLAMVPWLAAFLSELAAFTGTDADVHDDQVDALAYAWMVLLHSREPDDDDEGSTVTNYAA